MPRFLLVLLASLLLPFPCLAAGGHHAVDDAVIAVPGQCTLELWAERSGTDRRQLQHAGVGCHVMGLEAEINGDRETTRSASTLHLHALQLKWATDLQPRLSIGLVGALRWQDQTPRAQRSLLMPLSWTPRDDLAFHLNLGRTFASGAPDRTQRGAAVAWQMTAGWQFLAEVFHDGTRPLKRLGLRHDIDERLSLDLSIARGNAVGSAPRETWWTGGLNWTFGQ